MDPRTWGELIFNARVIVALIPLALRDLKSRAIGAGQLPRRDLPIYGLLTPLRRH